MKAILFLLMIIANINYAQEPVVYSLSWYERDSTREVIHFVSLSDQYVLNTPEDSLAIPTSSLGSTTQSADDYLRLRGEYRQRCADAMDFEDNDIVFIYDYANDKLLRFYVRGLNLIAVLSPYSFGSKGPASHLDYMIGFEINPAYLRYKNARYLVSIGKTNPFTQGKLKPVAWEKVDTTLFPRNAQLLEKNRTLSFGKAGDTYRFKLDGLTYFVQNMGRPGGRYARHVVVINTASQEILFEQMYRGSEGGDCAALNYVEPISVYRLNQYAGQLFKNHPPVIFGFMHYSFGCPGVYFIKDDGSSEALEEEKVKRIVINCDNRH